VADGIRDEIGGEPLEQVGIAARPCRLECDDAVELAQFVGFQRLDRDRREIDRLAPPQPALTPREREARVEKSLLLLARTQDLLADLAPARNVRVRIGKRELEQSTLSRQRRPQLVCHVAGETRAAHGPGVPLSGSPAGISFRHLVRALRNCGVVVSIGVRLRNATVPSLKVGSGKSGTPWERMHAAASM